MHIYWHEQTKLNAMCKHVSSDTSPAAPSILGRWGKFRVNGLTLPCCFPRSQARPRMGFYLYPVSPWAASCVPPEKERESILRRAKKTRLHPRERETRTHTAEDCDKRSKPLPSALVPLLGRCRSLGTVSIGEPGEPGTTRR